MTTSTYRRRALVSRRVAALTAIAVLGLAACSSAGDGASQTDADSPAASDSQAPTSDAAEADPPADPAAPADAVTLTVQDYYSPGDPSSTVYEGVFADFQAAHPGVAIEHVQLPGESYTTQTLQQAGSNSLPDVLMVDNPNLPQLAETGVLTPLADIGTVDLSSFIDSAKAMVTYKDTVYAVPVVTTTVALFYNKTLLTEAGVEPPTTWAELKTAAKALSGDGRYGVGVTARTTDGGDAPWQFLPFAWSNGASLADAASPEMQETLQLWVDLVADGAMSESVVSWGAEDLVAQFSAQTLPMMVNGAWQFPGLDQVEGLDYGVVNLPVKQAGDKPSAAFGGEVWTIPTSTPDDKKALAFELLTAMSTADAAVQIAVQSSAVPLVASGIPTAVESIGERLQPFVNGLENGHQRTEHVGQNWPAAARAITNAIQSAITGGSSVSEALDKAKGEIAPLLVD